MKINKKSTKVLKKMKPSKNTEENCEDKNRIIKLKKQWKYNSGSSFWKWQKKLLK